MPECYLLQQNCFKVFYIMYLALYQTTKFRQVQIECICRQQNKSEQKIKICFCKGRKHCPKGENASYQHFLLFPQCFQKPSHTGS